jgi:hypothetical protein
MSIEAMKQALEVLEQYDEPDLDMHFQAVTALRQAIEQAEKQEPVGYLFDFTCDDELVKDWFVLLDYPTVWEKSAHNIRPLYTVLQREWVGLTDDDLDQLDCLALEYVVPGDCAIDCTSIRKYARAIETKLKEKNHVS